MPLPTIGRADCHLPLGNFVAEAHSCIGGKFLCHRQAEGFIPDVGIPSVKIRMRLPRRYAPRNDNKLTIKNHRRGYVPDDDFLFEVYQKIKG